jgi:hypothetical protein
VIIKTKVPGSSVKSTGARIAVSELNLRKAAKRLLGAALVSPEVAFIQRELGTTATQQEVDAKIVAVRKMPWASIVLPD